MEPLDEDFAGGIWDPRLKPYLTGVGRLERSDGEVRMVLEGATSAVYSDAQLDDYHDLPRRRYPWHPPLRMTVRAKASHPASELRGTAGFGFWNNPFPPEGGIPALPRDVWFFFASPPSDMALAMDVPGWGWKAETLDVPRLPFFLLLPTTPIAVLLMRVSALYRLLWPIGQRAIGAAEAILPVDLDEWHTYTLEWLRDSVRFEVDGETVLETSHSPPGPLGFVAWMDNQYAVATPQGRLRFGRLDVPGRQWLALSHLIIEPLE